jgi:hypothetical protein
MPDQTIDIDAAGPDHELFSNRDLAAQTAMFNRFGFGAAR